MFLNIFIKNLAMQLKDALGEIIHTFLYTYADHNFNMRNWKDI